MTVVFSDCRKHRFILQRGQIIAPYVLFIGLNPSTADEDMEDNTARRLTSFTEQWGYLHWQIGNLSSYVATNPQQLCNRPLDASILDQENWYLSRAIENAALIVPCWDAGVVHLGKVDMVRRPDQVLQLCAEHEHKLRCFGRTKDGHPKHPLYLANDTQLEYWCDLA